MAVPKKKQSHSRTAKRRAQHKIGTPAVNACPQCHSPRRPHRVCPRLRLLRRPRGRRAGRTRARPRSRSRRVASRWRPSRCPRLNSQTAQTREAAVVAVDCNGADLGPAEVAAGARDRGRPQGARVMLFGPAAELGDPPPGVEVVDAPVSIAKSADPASAVRATPRRLDRAGRASRRRRPRPGARVRRRHRRGARRGAVQHQARARHLPPGAGAAAAGPGQARDAARRRRERRGAARAPRAVRLHGRGAREAVLGVERPRVGLLSNGEEAERAAQLVVETHARAARARRRGHEAFEFVGNVEGDEVTEPAWPTWSSPTASPATSR